MLTVNSRGITMSRNMSVCLMLFPFSASGESLIAKYKRCVEESRSDMEKPREIEAYRDRGCTTGNTDWQGRRKTCDENVCWDSAPHQLIVEAKVWDHSAAGSEHSYGSTQYLPSREFATRFCNSVHARSASGISAGRGWQKLSANVIVRRQITEAERASIEAKCEKKIMGN